MRLGLLGGTFDPPHVGHLLAAVDALEALGLDLLVFVPAGVQPFKRDAVHASGAQRLEMLRRMIGGDPRFAVDPIELERDGLSYTVDTLAAYRERYPRGDLHLLIGEDLVGQIGGWREPARIARLATIVVLTRDQGSAGEEVDEQAVAGTRGADAAPALPMRRVRTRRVDVSSTEVRERRRTGRSIRGFVSEAVAEYLESEGLYQRERT